MRRNWELAGAGDRLCPAAPGSSAKPSLESATWQAWQFGLIKIRSHRCQAVENFSYRVHRLATVAT